MSGQSIGGIGGASIQNLPLEDASPQVESGDYKGRKVSEFKEATSIIGGQEAGGRPESKSLLSRNPQTMTASQLQDRLQFIKTEVNQIQGEMDYLDMNPASVQSEKLMAALEHELQTVTELHDSRISERNEMIRDFFIGNNIDDQAAEILENATPEGFDRLFSQLQEQKENYSPEQQGKIDEIVLHVETKAAPLKELVDSTSEQLADEKARPDDLKAQLQVIQNQLSSEAVDMIQYSASHIIDP